MASSWDSDVEETKQSPEIKHAEISAEKQPSKIGKVVLLYGDTGAGKTYCAMTFPAPIFYIDTEMRGFNVKQRFPGKDIRVFIPLSPKVAFDEKDEDPLGTHETLEKISKYIIDFYKKIQSGEIKQGTIVLDSVTDLWALIQDWYILKLSGYTTKSGQRRADSTTGSVLDQRDWKIMNKKHWEILSMMRVLAYEHGINFVITARISNPPEYAVSTSNVSTKNLIRAQKDVAFTADYTFRLEKTSSANGAKKRLAYCEKFGAFDELKIPPIEELTYEKIEKLIEDNSLKILGGDV